MFGFGIYMVRQHQMCSKRCFILFQLSVQFINILRLKHNDSSFPNVSKPSVMLCVLEKWWYFIDNYKAEV